MGKGEVVNGTARPPGYRTDWVGWLILLLATLVTAVVVYAATAEGAGVTEIEVNNNSFISVQLEVKCDHNYKTGRYSFHEWMTIRRRSKKTVAVPTGMKRCEIWPKVVF